ncbi:endo-1,4-beta-xylanase, partial [Thermodesulfobacteriota bacterium]
CISKPEVNDGGVKTKGLKDYYADNYLIGAALFPELFDAPVSAELIKTHFSTITPENDFKWALLHPTLNEYKFNRADKIAEFAQANGIKLIGHTLVWHSQLGRGVYTKEDSQDPNDLVDSETLFSRIKDHIFTVAGRYKGKVHGWDVVNEALEEDGTFRGSNFYKIAGETFIEKAFEYAHMADPNAELYYNDYNLVKPEKRQGAIKIIKNLQEKGLKVDAVGIQAHWDMTFPELEEIEKSILEFSELGIKVMFTELDVSVLPSPWDMPSADIGVRYQNNETMNPYPDGIPDSASEELAKRYMDIFTIFNKHMDKISRVTFWGLHDGISWKNNFPIRGRTDYPLIFDREMNPKKAYWEIIGLIKEKEQD